MQITILRRRAVELLAEAFGEIIRRIETGHIGDFGDGAAGLLLQQIGGALQAHGQNELAR